MPAHTKKKKRNSKRSVRRSSFPARPTLKEHGFRIVRHNAPSLGVRRSTKNIHRTIYNLIGNKNIERPVYNYSSSSKAPKTVRIENELRKQLKKAEKEREKQERNQRRSQKASKASAMNDLDDMFSKMHM